MFIFAFASYFAAGICNASAQQQGLFVLRLSAAGAESKTFVVLLRRDEEGARKGQEGVQPFVGDVVFLKKTPSKFTDSGYLGFYCVDYIVM